MKLSIVIVNYNVRYFLHQCLQSVQAALKGIEAEVFVVDNCSQDDSVAMVQSEFPWVKLIANRDNPGFAKANNQAIVQSKGDYVLLLNPDTVVAEDAFQLALDFMDTHPDCGGLGVKMTDGKGRFLPESKRGLPTPWVAFCKIFGWSSLFPNSRLFGRYHLGFLSEHDTHPVDVLAGAFMMMPRHVIDKVGMLDEQFFMYGEDIDLSYRISLGGFQNYYFPASRILHYKGESTKKGSLNYVKVFYKAMIIFAQKHYSRSRSVWFTWLIHCAICFRAGLSAIGIAFRKIRYGLQSTYRKLIGYQRKVCCLLIVSEARQSAALECWKFAMDSLACECSTCLVAHSISQAESLLANQCFDEVVFDSESLKYGEMIRFMERHNQSPTDYKIMHLNERYFVGSKLVIA